MGFRITHREHEGLLCKIEDTQMKNVRCKNDMGMKIQIRQSARQHHHPQQMTSDHFKSSTHDDVSSLDSRDDDNDLNYTRRVR